MSQEQRFELHLPGLLKVLAEHLYSSKKVGVRELIQNAHDSCVRRRLEQEEPDYRPEIRIVLDEDENRITISDNGNGLTEEEITNYLSTIGRGYTRELRERLSLFSAEEAAELIGQFGLGFLSAFLLASKVRVVTRSVSGSDALCWESTGDEHYRITPGERDEAGTTVELEIKQAASFILHEANLLEAIRTYADFLPIPIYLGDDEEPVNLQSPPWEAVDRESSTHEYIARSFRGTQPLFVLPLQDAHIDLGHDSMTVPLEGFLFVPPGSVASVREFGDLHVYIRKMFICSRERDLLPAWARFVRGVVECPLLQPTASREGLHQDENFELVRQAIEKQLSDGLRTLATDDPRTWRQVVRGHADVITGWAVSDPEFFQKVADIVTFRTTRGSLSLPEYLELSGGSIYYVTRELGSLQEQILAEGRNVPAIDASWFSVTPFLEKYALDHPEIQLVQLDGDSAQLLKPIHEEPFERLIRFYEEREIRARAASFRPADVPAILLYPQGAELAREAEASLEAGDLPAPLAGLVHQFVEDKFADNDDLRGTLYLNSACPLIRKLAHDPLEPARVEPVLVLLHQMARLFAGRMLSAKDAVESFRQMTSSIEDLVSE